MSVAVWVAVALGGALGSVLRHGVGVAARTMLPGWPWGTWLVNVLGSCAIGMLFASFALRPVPEWVRFGLITGVLGGFTTFSAFSIETLELFRSAGAGAAGVYIFATLVVGLGACALGFWSARLLLA
ncbi:MAG: fluoride efflux transporter FluC [Panacagrimonas sp.]